MTLARPNNIGFLSRGKHIAFGFVLVWTSVGATWGQRQQPQEVEKRLESGELNLVRQLLMDVNPEYARLSFSDALNPETKDVRGWESWWSLDKARFFVFCRNSMDERGYLYLDGATNWLVHDLKSMKDISIGKQRNSITAPIPPFSKSSSFWSGGMGITASTGIG